MADICEVRPGHGTDVFNHAVKVAAKDTPMTPPSAEGVVLPRDRCFSLIFKDGERPPLDLAAEETAIRDMWVDALSHLVVTIRSLGQQQEYEM